MPPWLIQTVNLLSWASHSCINNKSSTEGRRIDFFICQNSWPGQTHQPGNYVNVSIFYALPSPEFLTWIIDSIYFSGYELYRDVLINNREKAPLRRGDSLSLARIRGPKAPPPPEKEQHRAGVTLIIISWCSVWPRLCICAARIWLGKSVTNAIKAESVAKSADSEGHPKTRTTRKFS